MQFHQQWQARALRPEGASDWFPAEVPGNVQWDYARFMGWGDVHFGENALLYARTEAYFWEYRTVLDYDASGGKAFFVSEGIDYLFDICLDGERVLSHEGMFTRIELPLEDKAGSELVIRIHPHPKREGAIPNDRTEADQSVKPPVCYSWDWHPRLLVSGLWQDAYVEVRTPGFIEKCEPSYTLNEDCTCAEVRFETVCDEELQITLLDPEGRVVGEGSAFTLDNPRLWWCNGQGEQTLYTYTARSSDHTLTGKVGFRRVRLVMGEGTWTEPVNFPKTRSTVPIQLELNGRRIFCKGSNWVSADIFEGRVAAERYEALVQLAKEANMNLLRCWGGSGIQKKAFYDACDRAGILLWVEFPLACNNYVGSPHYLKVLEQEATSILRQLRSHPAVAFYCGGNELFNNWSLMTDQSLALRLLNKLCYELDREKPFLMTSPLYGMAHGGYVFYDREQQLDVFQLFRAAHNTAYTEFGCSALAEADILREIIPEKELFPIRRTPSWILHHAFDAFGPHRWLDRAVLEMYTPEPLDTLEKTCALSNWLQCEGYKAIFEEARRQKPYCSMAINWDYNEPWKTAAGNNLVAYPQRPKPAYSAVQSALRPVLASAGIPKFDWRAGETFAVDIWLLQDTPAEVSRHITVRLHLGDNVITLLEWDTGIVPANTNKQGPTVHLVLPEAEATEMILELSAGEDASSQYRLRYRSSGEPMRIWKEENQ